MKEGDRVVLVSEISTHGGPYGTSVPADTICTLYDLRTDSSAVVRYGTDAETKRPMILGVASAALRNASEEDLQNVDYKKLLPDSFYPGSQFFVGPHTKPSGLNHGDILVVEDVKLAANEDNDLIFFNGNRKFKKEFVDMYFYKYDSEVEARLGEEVIKEDMKTAPRNYFLIGARMFMEALGTRKVVVLKEQMDDGIFNVEDVKGGRVTVHKDSLTPITSREMLLDIPTHELLPTKYWPDSKFKASESVAKHFLLKTNVQPNDIIEIKAADSVNNCNIFEDTYEVVNGDKTFYLSYAELESHFEEVDSLFKKTETVKTEEYEEVISQAQEVISQLKDVILERDSNIQIHEVSIYGFRFKIDSQSISIDGKEFHRDDIDFLIKALTELKEKII